MPDLNRWGPATVLLIAVVLVIVLAGAVVTIVDPAQLTFRDYLTLLTGAAAATGVLGLGRGVKAAGEAIATRAPARTTVNLPEAVNASADLGSVGGGHHDPGPAYPLPGLVGVNENKSNAVVLGRDDWREDLANYSNSVAPTNQMLVDPGERITQVSDSARLADPELDDPDDPVLLADGPDIEPDEPAPPIKVDDMRDGDDRYGPGASA